MQIIIGVIEGWIREHPEQWLWLHRRWRPEDRKARRSAAADQGTNDAAVDRDGAGRVDMHDRDFARRQVYAGDRLDIG